MSATATAPRFQIDAAEMLHQQAASFDQFRCRQAAQKLRGVYQVDWRLGPFQHQRFYRNVERARDLAQQQNRDVALPGFELCQVALGNLGVASQDFAGHTAPGAGFAHSFA